jgi:CubicO group peptidase (beta-lactamase class C family)
VKVRFSLLLVVVFGFVIGRAQVAPPLTDDEIRSILSDRVERAKQALGIVVGIVDEHGTRVIGYGKPDKNSTQTVNGDTVFIIGSVTKTFTATLLADMVVRGEVRLDDPISKYLPPGIKAPVRNGRDITLLNLATHTSGLPREPVELSAVGALASGSFSLNRYLQKAYAANRMYQFLSNYKLGRDPGAKYEYSNYGFQLLGHFLARRAGVDYESLLRQRVLDILDMHDTRFKPTPGMEQRLSKGYWRKYKESLYVDVEWLAPSGELYSTANDLLKYLAANLGLKQSPLMPAMEMAQRPQRDTDENHWGMEFIGLGWETVKKYDPEIVQHDGVFFGYRSFVAMDKKDRRGVVVLWNSEDSDLRDIGRHLLDARYPLWRQRRAVSIDPKLLDTYAGEYRSSPNYGLTFTREGKRFLFEGTGDKSKRELLAESGTEFFEKDTDYRVTFVRDNTGRLTATIYLSDGLDFTIPKIK